MRPASHEGQNVINESALLESKTLRDGVLERTLPDGMHVRQRSRTSGATTPAFNDSKAYETTGPPSESWPPWTP